MRTKRRQPYAQGGVKQLARMEVYAETMQGNTGEMRKVCGYFCRGKDSEIFRPAEIPMKITIFGIKRRYSFVFSSEIMEITIHLN